MMLQQVVDRAQLIKRMFKKANVLLSVCTHRTIDIDVLTSVMQLFQQNRHNVTWCPIRGDALIDRARSRVASYFACERKEDILFFVDDDVVFKPEDLLKIADDVMDGRDIVGGMYVQKGTVRKTAIFFDGAEIEFTKSAKPVEVESIATGFMAIHRRVFEKMIKEQTVPKCDGYYGSAPFYPFFQPVPAVKNGKTVYLSEDWAFCDRARSLGFKVWIDPSIFLGHKGEYVYDLLDLKREKKKDWNEVGGIVLSQNSPERGV